MNRKCQKCGVTMYFYKDGCECTAKQSAEIRKLARYGSKPTLLLFEILRKAQEK